MEPLNDKELNDLLRQWKPPDAPASLAERFFPNAVRPSWRQWLLNGSIRVPVPVGLLAAAILIASVVFGISNRQHANRLGGASTLAGFQPVQQLQLRVIRSSYETK